MKCIFYSSILFFLLLSFGICPAQAQTCNCHNPDPYGLGDPCAGQILNPVINGATQGTIKVCGLTTKCGSGALNYTVNLNSTQLSALKGYYWVINGTSGWACHSGIASQSGGGIQSTGFTSNAQISANINWIDASVNTLSFYGYTGWNSATQSPTTLAYYACVQVTVVAPAAPPAMPASIFMSSPVCTTKSWMYEASPCSAGATSYTWTGAAGGTFTSCFDGPALKAGQWPNQAYLCVKANNACGSSSQYCAYVNVPASASPPCPNTLMAAGSKPKVGEGDANVTSPQIYPNPARGKIGIKLPPNSNYNIQIVDSKGQVIKNITAHNVANKDVPLTDVSNGLYFVIITENGRVVTKQKIIVQH